MNSQRIHGHYESVKNKEFCINYCKKQDQNPLLNLKEDFDLKLFKIANEKH